MSPSMQLQIARAGARMGDAAGPPDKLKKSVSVSNVWQRAVKEASAGGGAAASKPLSGQAREARAALVIGRKWRATREKQTALSRTRLIERLELEGSVKVGVLRMVFFLCVFFFNLLLTSIDVAPEFKLEQRTNIRYRAAPPRGAPLPSDPLPLLRPPAAGQSDACGRSDACPERGHSAQSRGSGRARPAREAD